MSKSKAVTSIPVAVAKAAVNKTAVTTTAVTMTAVSKTAAAKDKLHSRTRQTSFYKD